MAHEPLHLEARAGEQACGCEGGEEEEHARASIIGPDGVGKAEIEEASARHPEDEVTGLVANIFAAEPRESAVAAPSVAAVAAAVSTLMRSRRQTARYA